MNDSPSQAKDSALGGSNDPSSRLEARLREITGYLKGSPGYETWLRNRVYHEDTFRTVFHILEKYLGDGAGRYLLDLGCGVGGLVALRAGKQRPTIGLDPHPGFLEIARLRSESRGGPARFIQGTGETLPFRNESFDLVTALDVLEHVESPKRILGEIFRVLKPGGRAYLIVVNRFSFWDEHYNLPFINWMPRALGSRLASWLRPHRRDSQAGRQELASMSYLTFNQVIGMAKSLGFGQPEDLRQSRLRRRDFPAGLRGRLTALAEVCGLADPFYRLLRFCYLTNFPVLLRKPT